MTEQEILRYAVVGLRSMADQLESRIVTPQPATKLRKPAPGRRISAEGRKRIAEAQKKRWAAQRAKAKK